MDRIDTVTSQVFNTGLTPDEKFALPQARRLSERKFLVMIGNDGRGDAIWVDDPGYCVHPETGYSQHAKSDQRFHLYQFKGNRWALRCPVTLDSVTRGKSGLTETERVFVEKAPDDIRRRIREVEELAKRTPPKPPGKHKEDSEWRT